MEITKQQTKGLLSLTVTGRLDGYWSDHLTQQVDEVMRNGTDQLQIDLAGVDYISSAGIQVLLQSFKKLQKIGGAFSITNPTDHVREILALSGMLEILASNTQNDVTSTSADFHTVDHPSARLHIFPLLSGAGLSCQILGNPNKEGQFSSMDCRKVKLPPSTFGIGLGALGNDFQDCRGRFGEFIAAAGGLVYQPTDGTNVPDYMVSTGSLIPELQLLHGIIFEGEFGVLIRFEANTETESVSLSELAGALFDVVEADAIGLVMVAESAGLIGAALRRSPALEQAGSSAFEFPEVRQRLSLTSEHVFSGSQALVAGILTRNSANDHLSPVLRPLGGGMFGHLHAAAFSYRAIPKGRIDLKTSIAALFETQTIQGVLHLLNDERERVGVGQSEFYRGACWLAPITELSTA